MLRSYLTVIRDSFRAAMNSRVLYIVLALIVIILLALAPLHLRQTLDWKLSLDADVTSPERLVRRLVDDGKSGRRAAVAHIWNQLSSEMQSELGREAARVPSEERSPGPPEGRRIHRQLVNEFNDLLENGSLYDEQAFEGKRLSEEAQQLIERGSGRSRIEDRRLNRLLLATALRRDVSMPGATQLDFYYLVWHIPALTTSVSQASFASGVTNQLPVIFDKFVMSLGIFIAILVTASIIPEMLEPGSLNLLLSKPVHRWGLLLAKYVGGCVFILLCAALFFVGIYLWLGIQFQIWDRAILLSIPVYVLVFAMYYSVSVLAGIWFRSPTLCITFAILFWAVCFVIGWGYNRLDYRHYNVSPRQMVATDDGVMMVDMLLNNHVWNGSNWKKATALSESPEAAGFAFATYFDRLDEFPDVAGPVMDTDNNLLLIVDSPLTDALSNSSLNLASTSPAGNWKVSERGPLPSTTSQVFYSKRLGPLAITRSGAVFRWTGTLESGDVETDDETDRTEEKGDGKNDKNGKSIASRFSGMLSRATGKKDYESISAAETAEVRAPSFASHNPENDEIAIYADGQLVVLQLNPEGQYVKRLEQPVGDHDNSRMTAFVAYRGSSIFVMLGNGRFYHVQASDLSVTFEMAVGDRAAVRSLSASPDGGFAAVTLRSGELWLYDAENQAESSVSGIPRNDILATAFDDQGQLWVGDRFLGANRFDVGNGEKTASQVPESGWMTNGFRYVIRPLYRIFPKPSEFYKVVSHLSSSGDAESNPDVDLTKFPHRDNPWSPLRSGLIFTALMLAISCLVFQRQDF